MFKKATWLHLRIPFSYFLLPVFLWTLATAPNIKVENIIIVFITLHFFLYPASNGYNSYFDKDEHSIGGLKHPPKVTKELYYTALIMDIIALILGYIINIEFAIMLFIYGMISKAYSHPSVRLKKFTWISWVVAGFFQGAFTYFMAYIGLNGFGFSVFMQSHVWVPAILTTLILLASYPMTQIYQHQEDHKRGDITLSYRLGIKGTFYFSAAVFIIGISGFFLYLIETYYEKHAWLFLLSILPVVIYFGYWYLIVYQNSEKADYKHTMWLNIISATCLNAFFIYFFLDVSHVMQFLM